MNEYQRKLIIYSLLSYMLGAFLFTLGISLKTPITVIVFFIIGSVLIVSGILSLYNNYKKEKKIRLYLFIAIMGLALEIIFTIMLISQLFGI